jgi:hypothetical protein
MPLRYPYTLRCVTPPTLEPVPLAEAHLQCRIDTDDDDAHLTRCIQAAREWCEEYQGRAYLNQTLRMTLSDWPRESAAERRYRRTSPYGGYIGGATGVWYKITLPRAPVQSISSITYVDRNGTTQTLAPALYQLNADAEPAVLLPAAGQSWPAVQPDTLAAIRITFLAGYGAVATAVPARIKQAILLLVSHWYEDAGRTAVLTGTISKEVEFSVTALLDQNRVRL